MKRMLGGIILILSVTLVLAQGAFCQSRKAKGSAAQDQMIKSEVEIAISMLQGKLLFIKGTGPVVKTATKEYPLAGRNQYLFATLEDKRLRNDEVRLKGWFRKDGNFQVEELNTIHHGELYYIRYYCETCNIVALKPGPCMCCQHPVELQEVPLNNRVALFKPFGWNEKQVLITH